MNRPTPPTDAVPSTSTEILDTAQFAAEFQQCHSRLWLLASAILGDRHLAEDVVQDAGVVALGQLDQFKPGTNFVAWLSQIVRLQAFNQSRKRKRRRTQNIDPVILDTQTSETATPQALPKLGEKLTAAQTFFDDQVMLALSGLREVARACVLLRIVHNLSYTDIAAMLDIAEGTAMSHVHRSKAQLRERLTPPIDEAR